MISCLFIQDSVIVKLVNETVSQRSQGFPNKHLDNNKEELTFC